MDDMSTNRYKELQNTLNRLRTLNSTHYLYTATRNDEGKLIYVADGLESETIYFQDIIDTTWGHIFTACYPDNDTNEIISALCLEMD